MKIDSAIKILKIHKSKIEKIRNTPIKDLMERMRLNREENKFRRNIRKGIRLCLFAV